MTEQTDARIAQLEADIEVMRAYVHALLGFLPREPAATQAIAGITRHLHTQAATSGDRKEVLDKAIARMNAMANVAKLQPPGRG